MITRRRIIIALFISVVHIAVFAGIAYNRMAASHKNVGELVIRALSRDASIDYVAHVVTTAQYNGKKIQTHATIYHQGSMERLEYSGKSGQQVWSMLKDGKSYTYLPKENKILMSETSKVLSGIQRSKLLAENYRIVSDGMGQVAGRDAYKVDISSRYDGRPSKRLWIDKQYLTVLKSIDYSASGDERGRTEIARIQYNVKISPDKFAIPSGGSAKMVMVCKSAKSMDLFKSLGLPIRAPKYMPVGYKVEGYHLFESQCNCDHRSAQITYTDGLNMISVFQTPKMDSCRVSQCDMAGSGNDNESCSVTNCDVAKTGQMSHNDRTIVVVGDLLPDDVQKIAKSVR